MVATSQPAKPKANQGTPRKWKPSLLIDIFLLARLGFSDQKIAETLGVNDNTFWEWKRDKPEVKEAVQRAQDPEGDPHTGTSFRTYVFNHLSPPLKAIWNEIMAWEDHEDSWEKINAVLYTQPKRIRQQLFIHAMVYSCFDTSEACRLVSISRAELESWASSDSDFTALLKDLDFHKKNFFEQGLIDLVRMRQPHAVMFANKTKNRDRGYGEMLGVDVKGSIAHTHQHTVALKSELVNPEELLDHGLPIEALEQLREALRNRNEAKAAEAAKAVEEVPAQLG